MTEVRLSFKDMCAKFDVTPRTLRYYEYIELLSPEKDGRARFYGAREVARMTLILRGRRFGFSLEEIRQWLMIYQQKGTKPQLEAWLDMADRHVIIKNGGREVPETTLHEAAALAAYHSQARAEPAVEIDIARRGGVRRIPNGPVGLVSYQAERTIRAVPHAP